MSGNPGTVSQLYDSVVTKALYDMYVDAGYQPVNNNIQPLGEMYTLVPTITELWKRLNNDGKDGFKKAKDATVPIGVTSPYATVKAFLSTIPINYPNISGQTDVSTGIIDEIYALNLKKDNSDDNMTYKDIMTYWTVNNITQVNAYYNARPLYFALTVQNVATTFQVLSGLQQSPSAAERATYGVADFNAKVSIASNGVGINGNSFAYLRTALASVSPLPTGVATSAELFLKMIKITPPATQGQITTSAGFTIGELTLIDGADLTLLGSSDVHANFDSVFTAYLTNKNLAVETMTANQAFTAFSFLAGRGFNSESNKTTSFFIKTTLFRTTIKDLAGSNNGQAKLLLKAADDVLGFLSGTTFGARASWFGLYKVATPFAGANLSSLSVALTMLQVTDTVDDIFTYLTSDKTTVNNVWFANTYETKASGATDFSLFSKINVGNTIENFNIQKFNIAVNILNYFATTQPVALNGTVGVTFKPTDAILSVVASAFGNNYVAYNAKTSTKVLVTYVKTSGSSGVDLAPFTRTSVPFTPVSPFILTEISDVNLFLSKIFTYTDSTGKLQSSLKLFLRSNIQAITADYTAGDANSVLFNNIATQIAEETDMQTDINTIIENKSGFFATGTGSALSNLLQYALSINTSSPIQTASIINTLLSTTFKGPADWVKIADVLTGPELYRLLLSNTNISQTLAGSIYNYFGKFTPLASAMITQRGGVTPTAPSVITSAVLTSIFNSLTVNSSFFRPYAGNDSVYNSVPNAENIVNTKLLSTFFGALDEFTVNTVIRNGAVSSTSTQVCIQGGSWLNYIKVNIAQSITGYDDSTYGDVGYPINNIFNTTMLYRSYQFNYENGVQMNANPIYIQIVSGKTANAVLGYSNDAINAINNNLPVV